MREHPIPFIGPMVQAILDGRKTMTRRVVKNPFYNCPECFSCSVKHNYEQLHNADGTPNDAAFYFGEEPYLKVLSCEHTQESGGRVRCLYGEPGDRLWVRETWGYAKEADPHTGKFMPRYKATHKGDDVIKWHPSIHLRRIDARITLEITGVRVERVQDISTRDAVREGVVIEGSGMLDACDIASQARERFRDLWDSLNAKRGYGWDANPYVWVIEFKRIGAGQ